MVWKFRVNMNLWERHFHFHFYELNLEALNKKPRRVSSRSLAHNYKILCYQKCIITEGNNKKKISWLKEKLQKEGFDAK